MLVAPYSWARTYLREEMKRRDGGQLPLFPETKHATKESKGTAFEKHKLFAYK